MPSTPKTTPRTSRTDAFAAAAKARDAAVDLASEVAGDLVQGIKKSNRYTKLRATVFGTWLLLTVVTLWVSCPSSGPTNSLGAQARLQVTSVGQVISIRNDSDSAIWSEVTLVIDDQWSYDRHRIFRAGEGTTVRVEDFRHEGQAPPADLRPKRLTIQCDQGRVTLPLLEQKN
jgi:hypothetical protein